MRDFYKHKLIIWGVSVALVFFLFWEINDATQVTLDPYIVLFIGVTKQIIALMMIFLTRKWTWRAVGVMSVMQGVAVLYIASAILYWNQELISRWNEPAADLGRSFLIAGLIPLLIGVFSYAWVVTNIGIKRRNNEDGETWDIPSRDDHDRRGDRQDAREDRLDIRAIDQDRRADEIDRASYSQELRFSKMEDREDDLTKRERD